MEINLNANTREDGKYFVFLKAVPLKGHELTLKTREKICPTNKCNDSLLLEMP